MQASQTTALGLWKSKKRKIIAMKTQAVEMSHRAKGQDSLSSEAWIINLFQYDDADGLNAVSKTKNADRLTSDGRPLYILDGYDGCCF